MSKLPRPLHVFVVLSYTICRVFPEPSAINYGKGRNTPSWKYFSSFSRELNEVQKRLWLHQSPGCMICCAELHPRKRTWNLKCRVWRWFSFPKGWFSGSMLIFLGVSCIRRPPYSITSLYYTFFPTIEQISRHLHIHLALDWAKLSPIP